MKTAISIIFVALTFAELQNQSQGSHKDPRQVNVIQSAKPSESRLINSRPTWANSHTSSKHKKGARVLLIITILICQVMYHASQTRTWPKKKTIKNNNNNNNKLPGQCPGSKLSKGRRNTKTRSLYIATFKGPVIIYHLGGGGETGGF